MSESVHHSIRLATSGDVDPLSRTLAAAFDDDPRFCYFPPGVRVRDERLRRAFAVDGARSLAYGGLWTTVDADAAAVWFPPGHWQATSPEDLRELPAWLRIGGRRMNQTTPQTVSTRGCKPQAEGAPC